MVGVDDAVPGDEPLALRGLPIGVAEDFDAPMDGEWAALSCAHESMIRAGFSLPGDGD
ncbi:hypothetical protein LBMAG42_16270 [Deltaproteobacteria bacterium]|nr:hypothetical protein LBMAG42_16270 [Deltaproteobacteria bacterium]